MKVRRCVCLDMWVSVWVSVCVWSVCFVAHRAKTYLYTETPPLQKPSPMTFVSILSPPHIIFSSLVLYHVSYSFLIAIIPGQVSPCWGMLPSPRQNALLSGLPSVEVNWKEETDQGHCCQKGVILFSQPLRTFGHTKELRPWDVDCSECIQMWISVESLSSQNPPAGNQASGWLRLTCLQQ